MQEHQESAEVAAADEQPENKLFPLKPNYTGPTEGLFLFVHHDVPIEWYANIYDRVDTVRYTKADYEQEGRKMHMRYVHPDELPQPLSDFYRWYVRDWRASGGSSPNWNEQFETAFGWFRNYDLGVPLAQKLLGADYRFDADYRTIKFEEINREIADRAQQA